MRVKVHKHHIIPRHAGGTDDPSNIEEVTIEEHAERHRILFETHGNEYDKLAWLMLSGQINREELQRELARITGKRNRGRRHTPEQNNAKSLLLCGNKRGIGYTHTEDWRKNHSEAMKGNRHTFGLKFKQKTTICPHCGINGGIGALKRYHFENCQEKKCKIN